MFVRPVVFACSALMLLDMTHDIPDGIGGDTAAVICPDPMSASVTPDGGTASWQSNTNGHTATFYVFNAGGCTDTYTISYTAGVPISGVSLNHTTLSVAPGGSDSVIATYNVGSPGVGVLKLKAQGNTTGSDGKKGLDSGYVTVTVTGPTPTSLLPYSANLKGTSDGLSYAHVTPAVGSMGTSQSLSLVYNSNAARPISLIMIDAGPTSPTPTTYQLQVQLISNSTLLTLMNGSTSVFYVAASVADRLTAAIDAKANGLATGSYPVRLLLTTYFSGSTRVDTISTRILVNDQTTSPFGAGVGLAGIGRLYGSGTNTGRLLIDGSGAMEYFDRTCAGCAFVSPAGVAATFVSYGSNRDSVFRLTSLDGSFVEFDSLGHLVRHNVLPSIQNLTFTWTNDTLRSVTDASGRGFTLTYSGGFLTQMTDFAGRRTSTTVANGLLVKVTDPDGGVDSLSYNANKQLIQLNSRTSGVWNYGYNALQQADTVRAPSATDYTGANVRPTSTVVTAAERQWQPSVPGTSLGAPKGSIGPDTIYSVSTDPLGNVSKIQADRFQLPTKAVDALGQITTVARDTLGNATVVREPAGHVTTATYTGYLLTASYDSTTHQVVQYTYGRTTANRGASTHFGWQDPDPNAGENRISLPAIKDSTLPASQRMYNILGDPTAGGNLPAVDGKYTIQFKLTATTPTLGSGQNSTITAYLTEEYSTNSGTSWTSLSGTLSVVATRSTPGVTATTQVFSPTLTISGGGPLWIRLILRGASNGNVGGGQVKVQVYDLTDWGTDPYPVTWFKDGGQTPQQLLAVQGGQSRVDYFYHDGTVGPAGTLKQEYVGNTLAPGTVPLGGAVLANHYPNAYGQDTLVIDGGGHRASWLYASSGAGGNLTQKKDALGHTTTFHYNTYGLVDSTTFPNAVKVGTAYDSLNRVTRSRNGLGYLTQSTYGATGLTRVTDAKGQVYKYDRNAWGFIIAQHDLGDTTKADSLKYDAAGNPRVAISRRLDTITLTYDQLGRLRTRSGPDFPAESLSYGLLSAGGSWVVATSSNGRDSLAYDKLGRLVYARQRLPGDTTTYALSYTYDSTGHLTNRSAPILGSTGRWVFRKDLGVLDTVCVVGTRS